MTLTWLNPEQFNWNDDPFLSSNTSVIITSALYVLLVIVSTLLSRFLAPIKPKKNDDINTCKSRTTDLQWKPWFNSDLKNAQTIHNINLILMSAIMLYGVIIESWRRMNNDYDNDNSNWSLSFLICEEELGPAKGALYYWSYMYYLSKYYELLDTVLQLARGKPPPNFILHVYHHAIVLIMAWLWCNTKQSLQFIGLAFNTLVHVIMYTYFLQRTFTGKVPKWKSLVTLIQIIQFVCSMIFSFMTLYLVHVKKRDCAGMTALYFNILFNITLLNSFINVFKKGSSSSNMRKKNANVVRV